jgi:Fur family zinc uptake transcriptional regulator
MPADPPCPACSRAAEAATALAARGARVTGLRASVLGALHHAGRPLGAYEVFDRLKEEGRASAPPAVYRALDFLEAQGLVHKLQSRASWLACSGAPHPPHPHLALFRICRLCGGAEECEAAALDAIAAETGAGGFVLERLVVEAIGCCAGCAGGDA